MGTVSESHFRRGCSGWAPCQLPFAAPNFPPRVDLILLFSSAIDWYYEDVFTIDDFLESVPWVCLSWKENRAVHDPGDRGGAVR